MTLLEQLAQGLARRLWWCQTMDMLADALKGAIAGEPQLVALATGIGNVEITARCEMCDHQK